jgi:hypothetical protein
MISGGSRRMCFGLNFAKKLDCAEEFGRPQE